MKDWKKCNIGDKILWSWNDFDGKGSVIGILTVKEKDHAIVEADGMKLWLDDDTCEAYKKLA